MNGYEETPPRHNNCVLYWKFNGSIKNVAGLKRFNSHTEQQLAERQIEMLNEKYVNCSRQSDYSQVDWIRGKCTCKSIYWSKFTSHKIIYDLNLCAIIFVKLRHSKKSKAHINSHRTARHQMKERKRIRKKGVQTLTKHDTQCILYNNHFGRASFLWCNINLRCGGLTLSYSLNEYNIFEIF